MNEPKRKPIFLWVLAGLVLATGLGFVIVPILLERGARSGGGQLPACKSNLKNIGTACEMYSTDFAGHYPPTGKLFLLTPNYLKTIPTCVAASKDTYSATYRGSLGSPDAYTFYCAGNNHENAGTPANFPQYNSVAGLISQP